MKTALATVELALPEATILLTIVSSRMMEMERMIQNLEEAEGMDAERWRALRQLKAEREHYETLTVKLEAAARELRR